MRGKVCTYSATEHGYGITPAYAGKAGQIQSQTPELGITPAYAGKS